MLESKHLEVCQVRTWNASVFFWKPLLQLTFKHTWHHSLCYYSILSWANIPLDYKRHCEKKGLMFDLFKPNIPHLWSGLISNKCFINKRVLLEKSRKKRSAPSAQFLPPRLTSLDATLWKSQTSDYISLTSRKPHMNDSGLYWMLMTVFDTLLQRLDASGNPKINPTIPSHVTAAARLIPTPIEWIWTCNKLSDHCLSCRRTTATCVNLLPTHLKGSVFLRKGAKFIREDGTESGNKKEKKNGKPGPPSGQHCLMLWCF